MFNKNETVCFLGDSITTHGHFIKEVFQFLADNYKDDKVKLYNCGVPGDCAYKAVDRLYEDCLSLNPDTVIIMFGANDIGRVLYMPGKEIENIEEKKEQFIDLYRVNIRKIVDMCITSSANVILCTPTPAYDEKNSAKGCNVPLGKCIEILKDIAEEKNIKLVDYNSVMLNMMGKEIFNDDGLHPSEYGHHIMAQVLLKTLGYINECDFETLPVYSKNNLERFKAEQFYRGIKMVEFSSMYDFNKENPDATYEDKISIAKKYRQDGVDTNQQWYVNVADDYIKNMHKSEKIKGELVKKTIEMYD